MSFRIDTPFALAALVVTTSCSPHVRYDDELSRAALTDDEAIDTLDYFVTKHPERALAVEDGSGAINQVVDAAQNRMYLMKWGPRSFIGYTWDAEYIYFLEEHEMDFEGARPDQRNYSFSPGYWFKRHMRVGEALDGSEGGELVTTMTVYDTPHTCNVDRTQRYFMKTVLEAHIPDLDLGGDLGKQDVIVQRLEQGTYSEKEVYSREYGLVRWQLCTLDGSTCSQTATFNRIAPAAVRSVERSAACLPVFSSASVGAGTNANGCTNRGLATVPADPMPSGVAAEVRAIYDGLLGGIRGYVEGARYLTQVHQTQGESYPRLRLWLIDQPEVRGFADTLYRAYLRRPMSDDDWSHVRRAYEVGTTVQAIETALLASPECRP